MVYSLKLATIDQVPLFFILTTPLGTDLTPCEQPAPASNAYKSFPINSTSATPEINPPPVVMLDGSWSVTVVRTPCGLIFETRPPVGLPNSGPTGKLTCGHCPTVEIVPPTPPSATYRFPSGPNLSPRGLLRPVANTLLVEI